MVDTPSPLSDSEARITLGLLMAVEDGRASNQRSMASELGIALGMANTYVRRCMKKGYIKVRQIPRNRYAYYLTPRGFAEKSRLTARYLSQSFNLFREAREQYAALLELCAQRGWTRIVFCGSGVLADIAQYFVATDRLDLVGIFDPHPDAATLGRAPVKRNFVELGAVDVALITDLRDPQLAYDEVLRYLRADRILAPRLLHISQPSRPAGE